MLKCRISFLLRSTVFKCTDKNGSVCCIKKMKVNRSSHIELHELVQQEIYLLENLNHPRIIKFLQQFHTTNHVCIVMEYAEGGPLSAFLQQKQAEKSRIDQYVSEPFQHHDIFFQYFFLSLLPGGDYSVHWCFARTWISAYEKCGAQRHKIGQHSDRCWRPTQIGRFWCFENNECVSWVTQKKKKT